MDSLRPPFQGEPKLRLRRKQVGRRALERQDKEPFRNMGCRQNVDSAYLFHLNIDRHNLQYLRGKYAERNAV